MLFAPLYVPDHLRDAVSDRAWIEAMLQAEAALAEAEAEAGVIPRSAAAEIASYCRVERFDEEEIAREARFTGNPAEPLARALRRLVPGDAARYVHYGATSQDIVDTAAMLVTRSALTPIESDFDGLARALAALVNAHRSALMAGRTLLQQALPIPFGLKAAGWLAGVERARVRLQGLRRDTLAAQLGGAAGSLAALGDAGATVLAGFARRLDLPEPLLPWHAERGRIGEIGSALSLSAGTLDKIALDIILLAQTEIGEVSEGGDGGGSSTLPQKHNPVGSVLTRACARQAYAGAEVLVRCADGEHERAAGAWQAEWPALSSALAFTGGAAAWLRHTVENLEVHPDRMQEHLDESRGLILAERVSLLLSERVGREEAHRLVRAIAARVTEGHGTLREALLADDEVRRYLSVEDIEVAMDPRTYLGASDAFIDRALRQGEHM